MTNHGGGCQPSSTGWQTGPKANLIRLQCSWAEIQIWLWNSSIVAAAQNLALLPEIQSINLPPSFQDLRPLGGAQRIWWNSAYFTKTRYEVRKTALLFHHQKNTNLGLGQIFLNSYFHSSKAVGLLRSILKTNSLNCFKPDVIRPDQSALLSRKKTVATGEV